MQPEFNPPNPVPDRAPDRSLHLAPLAPYESRLLSALAFFRTRRDRALQAQHCLSMYLRQSESRIVSEVSFYARAIGMDREDLLDLIDHDPDRASDLIRSATGQTIEDVFAPDSLPPGSG